MPPIGALAPAIGLRPRPGVRTSRLANHNNITGLDRDVDIRRVRAEARRSNERGFGNRSAASICSSFVCSRSVIGLATGLGAVALRALIGLIHNLCYSGSFSIFYDANVLEGASRFGDWIVLVADPRRSRRRVSRAAFRAGGQRPRRAGGDGRDLL